MHTLTNCGAKNNERIYLYTNKNTELHVFFFHTFIKRLLSRYNNIYSIPLPLVNIFI